MGEIDKKRESQMVNRLRSIAILLVVIAHSTVLPNDAAKSVTVIESILSSISFFGVWIFFMLGGYLFAYEKRPAGKMFLRKAETLILPWAFTGTLVYFWTYVRHGGISFGSFAAFLAGYGSYLWYMTVFTALLVVFTVLRRKWYFAFIPLIYGVVMTIPWVLYSVVGDYFKLCYFLAGGWPIAFSLGYIINRRNLQKKLYSFSLKYGLLCATGFISVFAALFVIRGRLYYWSVQYVPLCLLFTPTVIWLVAVAEKRLGSIMDKVGKVSFAVYLIHLPIAGIICNVVNRFDRGYSFAIRPFIVIAICWFAIWIFERLVPKTSRLSFIRKLIGLR